MSGAVQVALLGPLEVHVAGARWPWAAPKRRAVLEMLGLRAGYPLSSELLCSGLWETPRPIGSHDPSSLHIAIRFVFFFLVFCMCTWLSICSSSLTL